MDGKRLELVPIDGAFKNFIDRRKTAVVTDLIDAFGADGPIAQPRGGLQIQGEGLFAKHMLAGIQNLHGNFFMSRIRSADKDGITFLEKLLERSGGPAAKLGGH
ncbi:MAG: hypothetical protein WA755_19335 [Candidatus Acidiferrales bacterium]